MEPTKTQNNLMGRAKELSDRLGEFMKRELEGYGNLIDQLRVTGYAAQALVDFAEANLVRLKFEHDEEEKRKVRVYAS